jgi:hypothetical protein
MCSYIKHYTEAMQESCMVGMTMLEASYFLPAAMFPTSPLWSVSTSPKGLLLAKFVIWLLLPTFHLNKMARCQKGNIGECASGAGITAGGRCG